MECLTVNPNDVIVANVADWTDMDPQQGTIKKLAGISYSFRPRVSYKS